MIARSLHFLKWGIVSSHVLMLIGLPPAFAQVSSAPQDVEGQPLASNVRRLLDAYNFLGTPLPELQRNQLRTAIQQRDSLELQRILDPFVLFEVSINPELRVKVQRGRARPKLQQAGFRPVLVKVLNSGTVANRLRILSPQAGPVYSGASLGILQRQAQTELNINENVTHDRDRFLHVEMFDKPPMTDMLSGLEVEYALALIYSSESGKREATIGFDIGAGTQDLGFRGEVPVLFDVLPAIPVKLSVLDHDGQPTTARLLIRDELGHVYPPQAKRLAPDFFFQPHIYRADGETVALPPGKFHVTYSRGPEYENIERTITVTESENSVLNVRLNRWINPNEYGFYNGDHHIHGAGCSHYDNPTQGVTPAHMFAQVKGEGLNVGCVLTWGPCFDFQRQYFSPVADRLSEPMTLVKYDLEISGFGSAAMGHVCLLNLKDQTYPGSEETKTKGWPTWTVPVLRWAKLQGGYTGFPHSAFDIDPKWAGEQIVAAWDTDESGWLNRTEAGRAVLPEPFATVDTDGDTKLSLDELVAGTDRAADRIPNLALPNVNGGGALEICVSTAEGVCDFISAMDTARISEWNTWYHIMNSGFPLKVSGETDFPCMSSRRVGQGRVYVQLGEITELDFKDWCRGLAEGRSYVSDGYSHALRFSVNDVRPGTVDVHLDTSGTVAVKASVAFAPEVPEGVAYGNQAAAVGPRKAGDTINLHAPRSSRMHRSGSQRVELIVNGTVAAVRNVAADGIVHDLDFDVPVEKSCWIALRQFPQMHTNPVRVLVNDQPIRASRTSARWCAESIKLLWKFRKHHISDSEHDAAQAAYQRAIALYEQRAKEAEPGS